MVEIEKGDNFVSIYVARCKETSALLRKLFRLKPATADYWPSWNDYCRNDNYIGHSWTFAALNMVGKLKKLVGTLPYQYKETQQD